MVNERGGELVAFDDRHAFEVVREHARGEEPRDAPTEDDGVRPRRQGGVAAHGASTGTASSANESVVLAKKVTTTW